jgi:hypothetical protein
MSFIDKDFSIFSEDCIFKSINNNLQIEPTYIYDNDKYIINEDDLYYYNVNNSEQKEERFILKERFIGKREKIKFLLTKRKNKVNNDYTIKNVNDKDYLITKKEELKLRNRKAAQKSRDKKKKDLLFLIEENNKLKESLNDYNQKISHLCNSCKYIFTQNIPFNHIHLSSNNDYTDNNTTTKISNNLSIDFPSFQYHQSSFSFSISSISLFISLFLFIGMFSISTINIPQSSSHSDSFRSLLQNNSHIQNISKENDTYLSIKRLPQIIFDDYNEKKSYYMNFEDYYKLQDNNFQMCHSSNYEQTFNEIFILNKSEVFHNTDVNLLYRELNKEGYKNKSSYNECEECQKYKKMKKKYFNSVYFKLFVPLCSPINQDNNDGNNSNNSSHYGNFFLENLEYDNNSKQYNTNHSINGNHTHFTSNGDFYYEVQCKVMNFSALSTHS